jgi:hypothetical protein
MWYFDTQDVFITMPAFLVDKKKIFAYALCQRGGRV